MVAVDIATVVVPNESPYDSVPANAAVIVNSPSDGAVHVIL